MSHQACAGDLVHCSISVLLSTSGLFASQSYFRVTRRGLCTSLSPTSLGISNSGKSLMWKGFIFGFTKVRQIIMATLYGVPI